MKEATENWLKIAAKDLKIAEVLLEAKEPIGVIFHLHAAVEKTLKAIYDETKGNPPRIHRLKKLAIDCCGIKLKEIEKDLLDTLDNAFLDSRYPKSIELFEAEYNISSCKDLIKEAKELIKWLKSLLNNK